MFASRKTLEAWTCTMFRCSGPRGGGAACAIKARVLHIDVHHLTCIWMFQIHHPSITWDIAVPPMLPKPCGIVGSGRRFNLVGLPQQGFLADNQPTLRRPVPSFPIRSYRPQWGLDRQLLYNTVLVSAFRMGFVDMCADLTPKSRVIGRAVPQSVTHGVSSYGFGRQSAKSALRDETNIAMALSGLIAHICCIVLECQYRGGPQTPGFLGY